MKRKPKKLISLLLAIVFIITLLPTMAMASGTATEVDTAAALINAVEADGNIKLTADITLPEPINITESITLDLNGQTITSTDTALVVYGGATLTLDDSGTGGKIKGTTSGPKGTIQLGKEETDGKGSLIMNDGIVEANEYGVTVFYGSLVTVNGGTITSQFAAIGGNNTLGEMNMDINGGTLISAQSEAIYMPNQVTLDISDGTITGGISLRMGQVNISGGTITGMTSGIDAIATYWNYEGSAWLGDAIYVWGGTYNTNNPEYGANGNTCNITITGGTFDGKAQAGVAVYDIGNKYDQTVNIDISGGKFSGAKGAIKLYSGEEIKPGHTAVKTVTTDIDVSGGYFTDNPYAYLADGKAAGASDLSAYTYKVIDAVVADVAIAVGEPVVNAPEPPADKPVMDSTESSALEAAANRVALDLADTGLTSSANTVVSGLSAGVKNEATTALGDIVGEGDTVTVVVQPKLEVTPVYYDAEAKELTLDIKAVYDLIATTNPDAIDLEGDGQNAVKLTGEPQPMTVPAGTEVKIKVEIPAAIALVDMEMVPTLTIKHVKDNGQIYYYDAAVSAGTGDDDGKYYAEFAVTNGFSSFTLMPAETRKVIVDYYEVTESVEYPITDVGKALLTTDAAGTAVTGWELFTDNDYQNSVGTFSTLTNALWTTLLPAEGVENVTVYAKPVYPIPIIPGGGQTTPPPDKPEEPDEWENPYSDVKDDDWFYEAVKYVTENKLFEGDEGKFNPGDDMTRAMMATVLWRMEGEPEAPACTFTDVLEGEWYYKAVCWAAEKKVVEGYSPEQFDPLKPITREEMVLMLYRYAAFKGLDVSGAAELTEFKDADKISDWALDAMKWAVANKLVEGDEYYLTPGATANRAQVAALLMRYCEMLPK